MQYLGHIYTEQLFVYLKFKLNRVSGILSGSPTLDSNVIFESKSMTSFLSYN